MWTTLKLIVTNFLKATLARKLLSLVIFLFMLCIIDYLLGYSYNRLTENKISKTNEIQKLINNPKIDTNTKKELLIIEQNLLKQEHYTSSLSKLWSYCFNSFNQHTIESPTVSKIIIEKNNISKNSIFSFDLFSIHFITSAWLILISIFVAIVVILALKTNYILAKPTMIIITSTLLVHIGIGINIITSLIPILKYQIINYILNILIGFIIPVSILVCTISFALFFYRIVKTYHIDILSKDDSILNVFKKLSKEMNNEN